MRINSVPDVKCFCNNKNVLCAQSMVWHFVRHPVLLYSRILSGQCIVTRYPALCNCIWNVKLLDPDPLRTETQILSAFIYIKTGNSNSPGIFNYRCV